MATKTIDNGTETDYAVEFAAGIVTADTQRIVTASDSPEVTSLAVMDDWDESDRAKVNLIVGQAGIAAGAGAVGVTVPRVTLASDDPAVTDLAAMEVLLGTIDADTGSMATLLGTIDADTSALAGAVAGTEMQVDVVAELPAGTNNIGDVDVATIAAGETHIGEVGGNTAVVALTFSLDTSAYASGDVLADTQVLSACLRKDDGTAVLQSITLNDEDDQGQALDVIIFDSNVSLGTENAAASITDANARNILGVIAVEASDWIDLGGVKVANIRNIGLPVKGASGTDDLYVGLVSRGTGTYTASGITARFGFLRD